MPVSSPNRGTLNSWALTLTTPPSPSPSPIYLLQNSSSSISWDEAMEPHPPRRSCQKLGYHAWYHILSLHLVLKNCCVCFQNIFQFHFYFFFNCHHHPSPSCLYFSHGMPEWTPNWSPHVYSWLFPDHSLQQQCWNASLIISTPTPLKLFNCLCFAIKIIFKMLSDF